MIYEAYEYVLNQIDDDHITNLANNSFQSIRIFEGKKSSEKTKYYEMTVSDDLKIILVLTITCDFSIESDSILLPNQVLVDTDLFMLYKNNMIPYEFGFLYLPTYKEQILPIANEMYTTIEKIKSQQNNSMHAIRFSNQMFDRLDGISDMDKEEKKKMWQTIESATQKDQLPKVHN